ncbi:BBE domain-containing protein [Brevibacillus centrosporus]|uniref:BBE domain-containing protein n=1 Tax=Brevibacillus centrosporus TaxID=54910 RepID=UPI003B02C90C
MEREHRQLLRPLQEAVPPPKTISIRSASWITAARRLDEPATRHATFKNTSAFVYESFSNEAFSILTYHLSIVPGATAFVLRKALFMIQYLSYWVNDSEESTNMRWVEQFRTSMLPFTRGAYHNYSDRLIPDWPIAYFGENIAKLKKVKKTYAPENDFRFA